MNLVKQDIEKLLALYKEAKNTPVIYAGEGKDLATISWNAVKNFQKELAEKYNYDWEKVVINAKGTILDIKSLKLI